MATSRRCAVALLACVASLVGCDHATKLAAEETLRGRAAVDVVPGLLDLSYSENRDVAFNGLSRLSLHPPSLLLVAVSLIVTAGVVALWVRRRAAPWPVHAGFAMVVAGALGNAIDRAVRGHVIDFVHLRFWPVFNLADVLVVAGAALLFLTRRARRLPSPAQETDPS